MIIDELDNVIANPDLSKGYLVDCRVVSPDAKPIDNVVKFAYTDDDYITVQRYIKNDNEDTTLKEELLHTDHALLTICEDFLAKNVPEAKELIEHRKSLRERLKAM